MPSSHHYQRRDFYFDLPPELIAQQPLAERSASRLLTVRKQELFDRHFRELPDLLREGDLLVFNNTRVIPARLFARKETGGKVEILLERELPDDLIVARVKASKSPRAGTRLWILPMELPIDVVGREGEAYRLQLDSDESWSSILDKYGHMPLPPYIQRPDSEQDRQRYQTIYGEKRGAIAAPTAGLHFDRDLFVELENRGIRKTMVTLHVGFGTFQPVRCENLDDHVMHRETFEIDRQASELIRQTRYRGGRVIAVGTTVVRCLETAARMGPIQPMSGESQLFIRPGFQFRCVDGLITNFHLPESTLMMMVTAFAGYDVIMNAYRWAVRQRYRFFSYGDAMLIEP